MARNTKEEAQLTRSRLLDAAERMFERHGVSGTSLQDIAAEAGVTRGAIYWHFRDKADLFNAMMERVTLPLEEAGRIGEAGVRSVAQMRASFIDVLHRIVADAQLQRVFSIAIHKVEYVGELEAVRERHLGVRDECLADVERTLRGAMRRGELPKQVAPRAAALGLHALFDGLLQNWMLDPAGFELVKTGTQVLDAYLRGLAAVPLAEPAAALTPRRRAARQPDAGLATPTVPAHPVHPTHAVQPARPRGH